MVEASLIYGAVQTVGILIGVLIAVIEIRNMRQTNELSLKAQEQALQTRQAQLFMYMYDRWSDPELMKHMYVIEKWEWTDYDDFQERYGSRTNPDRYSSFSTIGRFMEGTGVLVKRKLVDPSLVDDLMSGHILRFWEKFGESIIKETQVRRNYPQYYEHIEYLYNVIKPIVEQQHPELRT